MNRQDVNARNWAAKSLERMRNNIVYIFGDEAAKKCDRTVMGNACDIAWSAMRSRHGEFQKRAREHYELVPPEQRIAGFDIPDGPDWFFSELARASNGPFAHYLIPSADRKSIGGRIAKLATALESELASIDRMEHGEGYPNEFWFAMHETSRKICDAQKEIGKRLGHVYCEDALRHGAMAATIRIRMILRDLASAATEWRNTHPVLTRGSKNPAVLYFVREITDYFRRTYGTPLREPTAALARRIFDHDIDAATVKKLAP